MSTYRVKEFKANRTPAYPRGLLRITLRDTPEPTAHLAALPLELTDYSCTLYAAKGVSDSEGIISGAK